MVLRMLAVTTPIVSRMAFAARPSCACQGYLPNIIHHSLTMHDLSTVNHKAVVSLCSLNGKQTKGIIEEDLTNSAQAAMSAHSYDK